MRTHLVSTVHASLNTDFHTLYTGSVEEKPDARLALITGAAIKLMAEAGADAGVIGHFALHYPSIVAAQLAPPPPPPPVQEIDLEALVRTTVQAVLGMSAVEPDGHARPKVANSKRGRGVELVKKNVIITVGSDDLAEQLGRQTDRRALAAGDRIESISMGRISDRSTSGLEPNGRRQLHSTLSIGHRRKKERAKWRPFVLVRGGPGLAAPWAETLFLSTLELDPGARRIPIP